MTNSRRGFGLFGCNFGTRFSRRRVDWGSSQVGLGRKRQVDVCANGWQRNDGSSAHEALWMCSECCVERVPATGPPPNARHTGKVRSGIGQEIRPMTTSQRASAKETIPRWPCQIQPVEEPSMSCHYERFSLLKNLSSSRLDVVGTFGHWRK